MSARTEGAINRLTAAVLALAVQVAKDDDTPGTQARSQVDAAYDAELRRLLEDD